MEAYCCSIMTGLFQIEFGMKSQYHNRKTPNNSCYVDSQSNDIIHVVFVVVALVPSNSLNNFLVFR